MSVRGNDITSSGMLRTGSSEGCVAGVLSVGQIGVSVDLLSYPGGEVCDVAVDAGSQDLTEAHAAPGRQAEERPAGAVLLAHQRAAAVALDRRTLSATPTHTATHTAEPQLQQHNVTMQESTVPAS